MRTDVRAGTRGAAAVAIAGVALYMIGEAVPSTQHAGDAVGGAGIQLLPGWFSGLRFLPYVAVIALVVGAALRILRRPEEGYAAGILIGTAGMLVVGLSYVIPGWVYGSDAGPTLGGLASLAGSILIIAGGVWARRSTTKDGSVEGRPDPLSRGALAIGGMAVVASYVVQVSASDGGPATTWRGLWFDVTRLRLLGGAFLLFAFLLVVAIVAWMAFTRRAAVASLGFLFAVGVIGLAGVAVSLRRNLASPFFHGDAALYLSMVGSVLLVIGSVRLMRRTTPPE